MTVYHPTSYRTTLAKNSTHVCVYMCVYVRVCVCDLPDSTTYDDVVVHLLDAQADIMRYPGANTSMQEPTVTVTVHVEVTGKKN